MLSSADDDDSLHDNMLSNSIEIPFDHDTISTTTDQFEDCATSELHDRILAPVINTLESYFNDESIIPAPERARSLLAASFGVVPDFSLEKEPYKSLNKNLLPTNKMYKRELMRRQPTAKSLRGKKNAVLELLLCSGTFAVEDIADIQYIKEQELKTNSAIVDRGKEQLVLAERARGPNITNNDRLRYIEAILSDDVKTLYRASQDLMTLSELENRNSVMRVVDFYDKVTEVFNDPKFEPQTEKLPNLHSDFCDSITLKLGKYVMTRDKAKDILVTIRPKLAKMVANYELSGNGAGQRSEEDEDYGRVDLEKCVDGDDRGTYLESGSNSSYMLYWWHKLDVEDFVQFTICTLDKFHRANASEFQLVSSEHQSPLRRVKQNDDVKNIALTETMGRIGDGIKTLSVITARREIESWQKELFNMEEVQEDLDEVDDSSTRGQKKRKRVERRIGELKGQINETKKICDTL